MRFTNYLPFKVSVGNSCLTLLSLAILSVLFYIFYVQQLDSQIEIELTEHHQIASEYISQSELPTLESIVNLQGGLPAHNGIAFELIEYDGTHLGGNVSGLNCIEGFQTVSIDTSSREFGSLSPITTNNSLDSDVTEKFRFLVNRIGTNCLAFGRSLDKREQLLDSMKMMSLWAIPLCVLPAILFSIFLARRISTKLTNVSTVIQQVVEGDLDKRLIINGKDEIDQLSTDINYSFDRLQESVQSLQGLSATIAHDLRSPLARLAIPLEAATFANTNGNTASTELNIVNEGLRDIGVTFDALLRITQIESGQRRTGFKQINLVDLVTNIVDIYSPVSEDQGHKLSIFPYESGTPSLINGDDELLQQLMANLLENAIRYCPTGSIIQVGVELDNNLVKLCVVDDGPGIPAVEHDRVFNRTYRVNESLSPASGTGLGLSLVRAVVDLHSANITLNDAQPGLSVTIEFPIHTNTSSER